MLKIIMEIDEHMNTLDINGYLRSKGLDVRKPFTMYEDKENEMIVYEQTLVGEIDSDTERE